MSSNLFPPLPSASSSSSSKGSSSSNLNVKNLSRPTSHRTSSPNLTHSQSTHHQRPTYSSQLPEDLDQESAFGASGRVYRKGQDDEQDLFFGSTRKDKEKQREINNQQKNKQHSVTNETSENHVIQQSQADSTVEEGKAKEITQELPFTVEPTTEMIAIDSLVAQLTSTQAYDSKDRDILTASDKGKGKKKERVKVCFCQGRIHSLQAYIPLCHHCGLLLCSTLIPSPLNSTTSCPSCHTTPILSSNARSNLLSKLLSQRETLEVEERVRIIELREQRKLEKLQQQSQDYSDLSRKNGNLESLFPQLGDAAGISNGVMSPMARKKYEMDKALGRGSSKMNNNELRPLIEQEKKNRVIRLDMKTHKVSFGNEKEKKNKISKKNKGEGLISDKLAEKKSIDTSKNGKDSSIASNSKDKQDGKAKKGEEEQQDQQEEEEEVDDDDDDDDQVGRLLDSDDDSYEVLHVSPGRHGMKEKDRKESENKRRKMIEVHSSRIQPESESGSLKRDWANWNLLPTDLDLDEQLLKEKTNHQGAIDDYLPQYLDPEKRSVPVSWSKAAFEEMQRLEIEAKNQEALKPKSIPGSAVGSKTGVESQKNKVPEGSKKIPGAPIPAKKGKGRSRGGNQKSKEKRDH